MTHLTPDELIDAMEGLLDAALQPHLTTCGECQRQLADLSTVLREARQVTVPEPSPLFWPHLSERVHAAIAAEALPSGGWQRWLRWPVLAPLGALALLLLALVSSIPWQPVAPAPHAVNDPSLSDVALAHDSWVMLADIVGGMDWDTARAAGLIIEPGVAEQAVLALSFEEQQELTRLLRAELQRGKS